MTRLVSDTGLVCDGGSVGTANRRAGVVERHRREATEGGGLEHTLLAPWARRLKGTAIVAMCLDAVAERSGGTEREGEEEEESSRCRRASLFAQPIASRLKSLT